MLVIELYFKESVARSFFEHVKLHDVIGLGYMFSMHDLLHDLVQSVVQGLDDCFFLGQEVESSIADAATNYFSKMKMLDI